jgi:hypothetical protein
MMTAEIVEIPLEKLNICGLMGTALIPLTQYSITADEDRALVIESILTELASKEVVIMGNTLIYTEGFDGFRIL